MIGFFVIFFIYFGVKRLVVESFKNMLVLFMVFLSVWVEVFMVIVFFCGVMFFLCFL